MIYTPAQRLDVHAKAKRLLREWDESEHPRDDDGKFAAGGGGSEEHATGAVGGGKVDEPIGKSETGTINNLKISIAADVGKRAASTVKSAIKAIPDNHAKFVFDVPIRVVKFRTSDKTSQAAGVFSYGGKGGSSFITIPTHCEVPRLTTAGVTIAQFKDPVRSVMHEIGHAVDHHTKWMLSKSVFAGVV